MKRKNHHKVEIIFNNPFYNKLLFLLIVIIVGFSQKVSAENSFELLSPDKQIRIQINVENTIQLSAFFENEQLFEVKNIALIENDQSNVFGDFKVLDTKIDYIENKLYPVVKTKSAVISEKYNQLVISFNKFNIEFRAYKEGIAYRFIGKDDKTIIIQNENMDIEFKDNTQLYFPEEVSMLSHNEQLYKNDSIENIETNKFCSLPMLAIPNEINVLVSESSLHNYPGMWLKKSDRNTLRAIFPQYPKETKLIKDRNEKVITTEEYIAKCNAKRNFPWRIFAIAKNDSDLLINQLVWMLSEENVLKETDWIKPGKVSWDWWNANNIYGVDFESGVNTETYKFYIDFASKYGLEYIILDEGWYKLGNLLDVVPEMNIQELVDYAHKKNVGIILWVIWKTLDEQLDEALTQFEQWGVKGIKVDFMQRDDQWMVNYYEKIAIEAAKHKLLVDFHGNYKPAGLHRKYPNVLTREGLRGLEHNKWADYITPDHNLTLPFIRMVAGPMDYTPGAMRNAAKGNHAIIFDTPMSKGTRVHQMAMYVVFESPLQMLADNPSNYIREPEVMEFLTPVPTVWDETRILEAKIGDYIVNARRSGNEWYIGAMNDWDAREFNIQLDFLEEGKSYQAIIFKDGKNAHRQGSDYKKEVLNVNKNGNITIKMSPGGGWVARIIQK
ncbi:MAG: glycoside hydrolase family 97 protein [Bacteroidales bacterium]|nr:glycoside hydrolase family 97 protein [Bacteroidales bacterium]